MAIIAKYGNYIVIGTQALSSLRPGFCLPVQDGRLRSPTVGRRRGRRKRLRSQGHIAAVFLATFPETAFHAYSLDITEFS